MALKGSRTTTTYLDWKDYQNILQKLEQDKEYKFLMLFLCGTYMGIRISDILNITWNQILHKDKFLLKEKKTGKYREITIISDVKTEIERLYKLMEIKDPNGLVFINKYGTKAIRVQWVNVKIKLLLKRYGILCRNASSHLLRKTFGRKCYEANGCSDKSLHILQKLFNHSSLDQFS